MKVPHFRGTGSLATWMLAAALTAGGASANEAPAHAAPAEETRGGLAPAVEILLETGQTVAGEPLRYPVGAPARVNAAIVTIPPGSSTGWHLHGAPMFGYLLSGELDVEYADGRRSTVRAGEALMEAMAVPHVGANRGDEPARVLTVLMGSEGAVRTIPVPAPGTTLEK